MSAFYTGTWTVVYRAGGTERCTWHPTVPFGSYTEARKVMNEVEQAGYKALLCRTDDIVKHGLPEGWTA